MVNVPPLLCSTPPPLDLIDDDIENEDLIDNTLSSSPIRSKNSNEEYMNSLPPLPDNLNEPFSYSEKPPSINKNHAIDIDNNVTYIQSSPPTIPASLNSNYPNNLQNDSSDEITLSQILSTETLSHQISKITIQTDRHPEKAKNMEQEKEQEEKFTKASAIVMNDLSLPTPPCHKFFLEDIENDASEDELYSPKVLKNFSDVDINSNNYFTIENVNKTTVNSSGASYLDQPISTSPGNSTKKCDEYMEALKAINTNEQENSQLDKNKNNENGSINNDNNNNDNDDEFGDFNTFQQQAKVIFYKNNYSLSNENSDAMFKTNSDELNQSNSHLKSLEKIEVQNKELSYFSQCTGLSNSSSMLNSNNSINLNKTNTENDNKCEANDNEDNYDNDDDDDEFGDFNTAEPIVTDNVQEELTNVQVVNQSAITTKASQNSVETTIPSTLKPINEQQTHKQNYNFNEHISKILTIMFPKDSTTIDTTQDDVKCKEDENSTEEINHPKLYNIPFTSIDSAKALEFQWSNSKSRQTFIESLGIDFRNILFGDNWNPALPRYAANLSFNPLMPMKMDTQTEISNYNNNNNNENEPAKGLQCIKEMTEIQWQSYTGQQQYNGEIITMTDDNNTIHPHTINEHLEIAINNYDHTMELNEEKSSNLYDLDTITTSSASQVSMNSPDEQILNNNMDSLEFLEANIDMNVIASTTSHSNTCDAMATSTYTGSFKETHIYTPSKSPDAENKNSMSPSKVNATIDFDYKKAAMGVIIDETVVKKEYRDIVYEPEFSIDHIEKVENDEEKCLDKNESEMAKSSANLNYENGNDDDDEFTDFQYVPSEGNTNDIEKSSINLDSNNAMLESFNATKSVHGMILSPAILLPQAIPLDMQKTQIEWGDSTASINPEELARIEELFPEPKSMSTKSSTTNSSQKSTPTHIGSSSSSSLSISATIAQREQKRIGNVDDDDEEDWSEFISVPINNINIPQEQQQQHLQNPSINNSNRYNNNHSSNISNFSHRQQEQQHVRYTEKINQSNFNTDEEWSDFVSSAIPTPIASTYKSNVPQFNSGAWQNANYYNNPLSSYHKGPINISTTVSHSPKHSTTNALNNNNNNNNNKYPVTTSVKNYHNTHYTRQNQQQQQCNYQPQHQQQIHIMQNFSTIPRTTNEYVTATATMSRNSQFQIGSAKVAPAIALIPDLGFIAPAIPTHTSFINSLPRSGLNTKK